MILTHPWLFNAIVILFIAFTSGWLVFVLTGRRSIQLRKKIRNLEAERKNIRARIHFLEDQLQGLRPPAHSSTTPVIPFTTHNRANKTNG